MVVDKKEVNLPVGIYHTRVDIAEDGIPTVPEPEAPSPVPEKPEVHRSEWEPKWRRYVRDRKAGKLDPQPDKKTKIEP